MSFDCISMVAKCLPITSRVKTLDVTLHFFVRSTLEHSYIIKHLHEKQPKTSQLATIYYQLQSVKVHTSERIALLRAHTATTESILYYNNAVFASLQVFIAYEMQQSMKTHKEPHHKHYLWFVTVCWGLSSCTHNNDEKKNFVVACVAISHGISKKYHSLL
jgi:hypothetical protein